MLGIDRQQIRVAVLLVFKTPRAARVDQTAEATFWRECESDVLIRSLLATS